MVYSWTIPLLISVGGAVYFLTRSDGGDYDFSMLFFLPAAIAWFLFVWMIYFALMYFLT